MIYDPWKHADQLGLRIIEGNPGIGNRGLWAGNNIIILQKGLSTLKARCTLSHEIVHAQYDMPLIPHDLSPKAEARADRIAASRLITPSDYTILAQIYRDNPAQLAFELGVTPKILAAYIKNYTQGAAI